MRLIQQNDVDDASVDGGDAFFFLNLLKVGKTEYWKAGSHPMSHNQVSVEHFFTYLDYINEQISALKELIFWGKQRKNIMTTNTFLV